MTVDTPVVAEALRITGRNRRPVFGSAVLAGAAALLVGGESGRLVADVEAQPA
ncbi:hypothetical protein ACFQ0Q_49730 [Streptomyces aureus]